MRRKAIRAIMFLVLAIGVLTFSVPSYAKLVVLSYSFANDAEGFSINTVSDCGANFAMAGGGGLTVSATGAAACGGQIELRKIVVLGAPIEHPSVTMVIQNDDGIVDLDRCGVSFNGSDPTRVIRITDSAEGTSVDSSSAGGAISGETEMVIRIPFSAGASGQFQINNVSIESN